MMRRGIYKPDSMSHFLRGHLKQAKAAQFAGPGVAVATAHLQLVRIRTVRALMKAFNLESSSIVQLNRSAALDRYQRFAHTKRRRAARKLEGN
jgi:hypothetical protein